MAKKDTDSQLVAVRWDRPGSCHHGQVHRVSRHLVDYLDGGKVVVWWPSRAKGKEWKGELVEAAEKTGIYMCVVSASMHAAHPSNRPVNCKRIVSPSPFHVASLSKQLRNARTCTRQPFPLLHNS